MFVPLGEHPLEGNTTTGIQNMKGGGSMHTAHHNTTQLWCVCVCGCVSDVKGWEGGERVEKESWSESVVSCEASCVALVITLWKGELGVESARMLGCV